MIQKEAANLLISTVQRSKFNLNPSRNLETIQYVLVMRSSFITILAFASAVLSAPAIGEEKRPAVVRCFANTEWSTAANKKTDC